MKPYTDLNQSKKLAEILPIESADMEYLRLKETNATIGSVPFVKDESEVENSAYDAVYDRIPCWSLAALLGVLPHHLIVNNKTYAFSIVKGFNRNGETYAIKYAIFNTTFYFHLTEFYNNPVDACYEMILHLHKNDIL